MKKKEEVEEGEGEDESIRVKYQQIVKYLTELLKISVNDNNETMSEQ